MTATEVPEDLKVELSYASGTEIFWGTAHLWTAAAAGSVWLNTNGLEGFEPLAVRLTPDQARDLAQRLLKAGQG
jgi:hypothetical protein